MAITKVKLYDADHLTALNNLFNFLTEYAVPEYFSSVEIVDDGSTGQMIKCYIEGMDYAILTIAKTSVSTSTVVNTIWYTSANSCNCTATKLYYLQSAYITSCALTFSVGTDTEELSMPIIITKDNNGDTVVLGRSDGFWSSSTTSSAYLYAHTKNTVSQVTAMVQATAEGSTYPNIAATTFTPIVLPDNKGSYTPDVFLMVFAENRSIGIIELNGVKYLSNGSVCMRIG